MNIIIITQLYPQPDDQGDNKVTRTVEYFAKEWVSAGHKVIVMHCSSKFPLLLYAIPKYFKDKYAYRTSTIIPPYSSRKPLEREEFGIMIHRIPIYKPLPGRPFSKKRILRTEQIIIDIASKANFRPDVIVGHFANPSLELVKELSNHYKCMSSIVFHGDCNENSIHKYRILENISNIKAIGVRSSCEADSVKKLLHLKKEPFICYSGVPNDSIKNSEKVCYKHSFEKGIRYIYVGSLILRKHLDSVIKAFSKVRKSNDSLIIVGGGPEEKQLKKLAVNLRVDNQVKFVGRVDRSTVLNYMKESHIFTLISEQEVFGMVYFESMLQGCLTIASRGGGFDGIIKDGFNGFLCNPGDAEELSKIYERIINMSVDKRNEIGKRSIDNASIYSESYVADKYMSDILERNS